MLKKIFSALGMGFLLAVFYLLLSLGGRQEKAPVQQIPASPLPSIGSVSSASLPDLAAVFGAQVPFVSLSGCDMTRLRRIPPIAGAFRSKRHLSPMTAAALALITPRRTRPTPCICQAAACRRLKA